MIATPAAATSVRSVRNDGESRATIVPASVLNASTTRTPTTVTIASKPHTPSARVPRTAAAVALRGRNAVPARRPMPMRRPITAAAATRPAALPPRRTEACTRRGPRLEKGDGGMIPGSLISERNRREWPRGSAEKRARPPRRWARSWFFQAVESVRRLLSAAVCAAKAGAHSIALLVRREVLDATDRDTRPRVDVGAQRGVDRGLVDRPRAKLRCVQDVES